MNAIAALATVIILLQLIFSLYQVRYYNRFVRHLASKYNGVTGYTLTTDVAKHLLASVVVAVITDENGVIIELYFYSGLTIFSRFKRFENFDDEKLDTKLISQMEQEKSKLKKKVFKQLVNKEMETITI